MVIKYLFVIILLFLTIQCSHAQQVCEILARTAFDSEVVYDSNEQYETAYETLKSIASQVETQEEFEDEIKRQGLDYAYNTLQLGYKNKTGQSTSSVSHIDLFESFSKSSYSEYAMSNMSSSNKKTFVREALKVLDNCIKEEEGFFAIGEIDSSFNILKIKLFVNKLGTRHVDSVNYVPSGVANCNSLVGRVVVNENEVLCERSENKRVAVEISLDPTKEGTPTRVVVFPKVNKVTTSYQKEQVERITGLWIGYYSYNDPKINKVKNKPFYYCFGENNGRIFGHLDDLFQGITEQSIYGYFSDKKDKYILQSETASVVLSYKSSTESSRLSGYFKSAEVNGDIKVERSRYKCNPQSKTLDKLTRFKIQRDIKIQ
ncbi:MAG: hypothetical protein AB2809_13665 [Candidatus Thiodiazotropha sp.]